MLFCGRTMGARSPSCSQLPAALLAAKGEQPMWTCMQPTAGAMARCPASVGPIVCRCAYRWLGHNKAPSSESLNNLGPQVSQLCHKPDKSSISEGEGVIIGQETSPWLLQGWDTQNRQAGIGFTPEQFAAFPLPQTSAQVAFSLTLNASVLMVLLSSSVLHFNYAHIPIGHK